MRDTDSTTTYRVGTAERLAFGLIGLAIVFLGTCMATGWHVHPTTAAILYGDGNAVTTAASNAVTAPVIEEDDPRWSCATMGNRVCGYGVVGGPSGAAFGGELRVTCPEGGSPTDLPWVPITGTDVVSILESVGCGYGHTPHA